MTDETKQVGVFVEDPRLGVRWCRARTPLNEAHAQVAAVQEENAAPEVKP